MAANDTNVVSNNKPYKTGSVLCLFGFYDKGALDKNGNILPVRAPDFYKEVELTNEVYNSIASALLSGQPNPLEASANEMLFFVNVNTVFGQPATLGIDYIISYYHCLMDINLFSFYDPAQNKVAIDPEVSEQRRIVLTQGSDEVDKLQYIPFFAVSY